MQSPTIKKILESISFECRCGGDIKIEANKAYEDVKPSVMEKVSKEVQSEPEK